MYTRAHYAMWARNLPAQADRFTPGAFGENVVLDGLAEADIRIGDRFDLGTAFVEVSRADRLVSAGCEAGCGECGQ
tara:strand:+ start:698 stop:925 length:228 start_codon:yes stop_codon:yes gene_type:complete